MKIITNSSEVREMVAGKEIPELAAVPLEVVQQFLSKLKFEENGLAHSDYDMLDGYVPDAELPKLFSHFGIDQAKFDLVRDSSCVSGVCFVHPRALCDPERCRH